MPTSSLTLRLNTTLLSLLWYISLVIAVPHTFDARQATSPVITYTLNRQYSGSTFFSNFGFFGQSDPNHGFVTYGSQAYAESKGLISFGGDYSVVKVDSGLNLRQTSNPNYYRDLFTESGTIPFYNANGIGRKSVRIESLVPFTHGLVIADIKQMPSRSCGTVPFSGTLGADATGADGEIYLMKGAKYKYPPVAMRSKVDNC